MRYTTIIDISEYPELYRNTNIRILYLHMVLKSGYHDDDRDQCRLSIRRLSYDTGLTISAVRHALGVLQKFGLVVSENGIFFVKKFVLEKPISPRIKSEKKRKEAEQREHERLLQEEQNAREKEEKRRYLEERKRAGGDTRRAYVIELMKKAENGDQDAAETLRTSLVYKSVYQSILNESK